jgi:hypothetical protein
MATEHVYVPRPLPDLLPGLVPDEDFDEDLKKIIEADSKRYSDLCVGIALIENDPRARFAGYKPDEEVFVASTTKAAVAFAAFQLRGYLSDLVAADRAGEIVDKKSLLDAARKGWRASENPTLTALAGTSSWSADAPRFDRIFDWRSFKPPASPRFGVGKLEGRGEFGESELDELDEKLEHTPDPDPSANPTTADEKARLARQKDLADKSFDDLTRIGFYERLRLMIGWSTNFAATTCMSDLGTAYIDEVLRSAGLLLENGPTKRESGIVVRGGYTRHPSRKFPTKKPKMVPVRSGGEPTSKGASARTLTSLFAHGLLGYIPTRSSSACMDVFDLGAGGTDSFIEQGVLLNTGAPAPTRVLRKIGIGARDDKKGFVHSVHDLAYIERPKLKYVLCILDANHAHRTNASRAECDRLDAENKPGPTEESVQVIRDLALKVDQMLLARRPR